MNGFHESDVYPVDVSERFSTESLQQSNTDTQLSTIQLPSNTC